MKKQHFPMDDALPENWPALEQRLRAAELRGPRPGFSGRWLARLASQPAPLAATPRQVAAMLAAGGLLSLALLALLWSLVQPGLPQVQLGGLLAELVSWLSTLAVTTRVLLTTLSNILSEIPLAAWLLLSTSALVGLLLLAMTLEHMQLMKENQ